VGTPLLGAVVLPRLSNLRAAEPMGPAVTLSPPSPAKSPSPGPRPDETAVLDRDLMQPKRFPTNTISSSEKAAQQVRQRVADSAEEITAVIDMSGLDSSEVTPAQDGDTK